MFFKLFAGFVHWIWVQEFTACTICSFVLIQPHPRGSVYPPVQVFLLFLDGPTTGTQVNYLFSLFFFFKSRQSTSVFSYFGSFLDGVGWLKKRGIPHGSVGDLVLCSLSHFSSFQGDIAKPFKANTSSKKQCFQANRTNDIQWRNSLAVLIHDKCSFKSLQDVSALVSNTAA